MGALNYHNCTCSSGALPWYDHYPRCPIFLSKTNPYIGEEMRHTTDPNEPKREWPAVATSENASEPQAPPLPNQNMAVFPVFEQVMREDRVLYTWPPDDESQRAFCVMRAIEILHNPIQAQTVDDVKRVAQQLRDYIRTGQ